MHSKHITLCADDFGQNQGISQGITSLVQMQRLSAVSCMVNARHFITSAPELLAVKQKIATGLHFSITEGSFLTEPERPIFTLNQLLVKSHLRMIPTSFIAKEFHAQLDLYIKTMGSPPDFIDGHQHVHQFPGIRQIILEVYEQRLKTNGTLIRATYPAIRLSRYQLKANILALSGGRALHARLKRQLIPHNHFFAGVYDFAEHTDYRKLFRQWLHLAPDNTLIMCHPGEGGDVTDPLLNTRQVELQYFASDEFLDDCRENHVVLLDK